MAGTIQTIIGAVIVASLVIVILVKGIIDKKKGKTSCSCGGNCGACNLCSTAKEEVSTKESCVCEQNNVTKDNK